MTKNFSQPYHRPPVQRPPSYSHNPPPYRTVPSKKRRKHKNCSCVIFPLILIVLVGGLFFAASQKQAPSPSVSSSSPESDLPSAAEEKLANYALSHGLSLDDYPQSLRDLLERNPETETFVTEYPLKKDDVFTGSLEEYSSCETIPLLMQWDQRWGYKIYGDDVLAITGCGPTCLSMVSIYLLHDTEMTPAWMADYSTQNGYSVYGNGTSWSLMSEGASGLGLEATELPLDEGQIESALDNGSPIIAIMGPGDFTDSGHYIIFTGWHDGNVSVNDPNSRIRSEKLWNFEQIKSQIRNLWSYCVA